MKDTVLAVGSLRVHVQLLSNPPNGPVAAIFEVVRLQSTYGCISSGQNETYRLVAVTLEGMRLQSATLVVGSLLVDMQHLQQCLGLCGCNRVTMLAVATPMMDKQLV